MLQILDTGTASAEANMSLDAKLLSELDPKGNPILHFYRWAGPSATYGHFIKPSDYFDLEKTQWHNLALAKRPTGGGIIFHIWDFAFSFLMPAENPHFSVGTLDNYRFVNETVLEVMRGFFSLKGPVELHSSEPTEDLHFCMAKPTQYDVIHQGLKVAGAAQRRTKKGYLHQGSISLAFPQLDLLTDVLLSKQAIVAAMTEYSFAPLGRHWDAEQLQATRQAIQEKLATQFKERLL